MAASLVSFFGVLWSRRFLLKEGGQTYLRSLAKEPSRCDCCGARVKPWALLPVLGFILSRGRCHSCSAAIPVALFVTEALAFGFAFWASIALFLA